MALSYVQGEDGSWTATEDDTIVVIRGLNRERFTFEVWTQGGLPGTSGEASSLEAAKEKVRAYLAG